MAIAIMGAMHVTPVQYVGTIRMTGDMGTLTLTSNVNALLDILETVFPATVRYTLCI